MARLEVGLAPPRARKQAETERWLAAKDAGIGGSSAAAAIGLGRHGSRLALWAEMTGQVAPEAGWGLKAAERMRWGLLLEQAVLRETVERVGETMGKRGVLLRSSLVGGQLGVPFEVFHFKAGGQALVTSPVRPWQHYSPDGVAYFGSEPVLLEAKTTGVFYADDWQSEPPEQAFIQVQHGLAVLGIERALISVLIGGQELRIFEVKRDEELIELINAQEEKFIECVRELRPPELESPVHEDSIRTLKLLYPDDSGETIELPDSFAVLDGRRVQCKAVLKAAGDELKTIDAQFRDQMKTATYARIPGYDIQYTLKTTKRKGYTVEPTQYRELRREVLK